MAPALLPLRGARELHLAFLGRRTEISRRTTLPRRSRLLRLAASRDAGDRRAANRTLPLPPGNPRRHQGAGPGHVPRAARSRGLHRQEGEVTIPPDAAVLLKVVVMLIVIGILNAAFVLLHSTRRRR